MELTESQQAVIYAPLNGRVFAYGRAGTGKSSAGVERLRYLIEQGVPAHTILMLAPQRTMQEPYLNLLYSPQRGAGGEVTSATIGGLARRSSELFWALAAEQAGFANPNEPPTFLTLETAQYYMARLVRPLLEQGLFQSVNIDRNRLYSQILDNLNKAAIVGFPHTEIGARMDAAWNGDPAQRNIYKDAQTCANLFRQYCLDHNLLDFSLQLEIFSNILWRQDFIREHLAQSYRHLIYDNAEEDGARAHDILAEWLPNFDSALLIYDEAAGYRYFLGGDSQSGYGLNELCETKIYLAESFICSPEIMALSNSLTRAIQHQELEPAAQPALNFIFNRYYPEMLDEVVRQIDEMIQAGYPPQEIVVLAPFLSDALRFSITDRLERANIPWRTHRPSRSLRDEPASAALLTLTALAHPQWGIRPAKFDVAHALAFALNTDLIRAQLLTEITYRAGVFSSFEEINPDAQERITYALGERYSALKNWLAEYQTSAPPPLDFFLRKLFGEVLSQPDYGFHRNYDAVRVAASLVESTQKFRSAMQNQTEAEFELGKEYLAMLEDGALAAQYTEAWRVENENAVLVAPAHTFLMMNRPAAIQFWLDPGSNGWAERLSQPLTHPYVLSRNWESGRVWTDADEVSAETEALTRLTSGLLSRCREKVILALADLSETGYEQRGTLLKAFQKVTRAAQAQ